MALPRDSPPAFRRRAPRSMCRERTPSSSGTAALEWTPVPATYPSRGCGAHRFSHRPWNLAPRPALALDRALDVSLARRSSVQNALVYGIDSVDGILPGISRRNAFRGGGKTFTQLPVKHQLPHASIEPFLVALSDDQSIGSILNELRDAAGPECDHRSACGEGLEKNQPECFLKHGGQNKDVGRRIIRIDFTGRDQAENEGTLACHGRRKSVPHLLFCGLQRFPVQPSFFNP